jgi:transposase
MEVVHEVCCVLDVHKKSVTACVLGASGRQRQTREFGTFTKNLLEMSDWLRSCGVTHVALESTGVYWKPVWNLLEGQFEVLLMNAQHIKAVPGRKTDQKDSEWIADLLQHGLCAWNSVCATSSGQAIRICLCRQRSSRRPHCERPFSETGIIDELLVSGVPRLLWMH